MKLNVLTLLALVASGLTLTSNSHAGVIAALGGDYQTPTPKAGWQYLQSDAPSGGGETDLTYGSAVGNVGNIGYGGGGNVFNLPCVLGTASTGNFRVFTDGGNNAVLGTDLLLHPGDTVNLPPTTTTPYVIVRYTISASDITNGTVAAIDGSFRRSNTAADGVEVFVFQNSTQLWTTASANALTQAAGTFSLDTTVVAGDTLSFVLGNHGGLGADESALRGTISLTNHVVPPSITSGPTMTPDGSVLLGGSFTLSVSARGLAPLSYQWRHAGTNLPAGTTPAVDCLNVTAKDSGNYDVVISNTGGSITSSVVNVTVVAHAGIVADLGSDYQTPIPKAGWQYLQSDAPAGGAEVELTSGSGVGSVGNLGYGGGGNSFNLPCVLGRASTGNFRVFGDGGNNGVVGTDLLLHPGDVANLGPTTTTPFVILRYIISASDITNGTVAAIDGSFRRSNTAADGVEVFVFQNSTQIWTAASPNDLSQAAGTFGVDTTVAAGDTISFVLGNHGNLYGDESAVRGTISLTNHVVPPTITSGPTMTPSGIVLVGGSFFLSVTARGLPLLSYQWRHAGTNLPAGTTSTVDFSNVAATDSGSYDVVISNTGGSITSSVVNVAVVAHAGIVADLGGDYQAPTPKAGWQYLQSDAPAGGAEIELTYGSGVGSVGNLGYGGGGNSFNLPCVLGRASTGNFRVFGDGGNNGVLGTDLLLHPGDTANLGPTTTTPLVILRYTISASDITNGTVAAIDGSFRRSNTASDGVEVFVFQNSTQLWTAASSRNLSQAAGTFGVDTTVAAGDTISFVLGNHGNLYADESALRGTITLTNRGAPAAITSGPTATPFASVFPGNSFTLSVNARGLPPLSYQWRHTGTNLPAKNAPTVDFLNATTTESGAYDVVVMNSYGAVTSAVVVVTVLDPSYSSGTGLVNYRLGDDDPGAADGSPGNAVTKDALGTNDLAVFGAPFYSTNVPASGGEFSMSFDGASYYQSATMADLYKNLDFNNFSLACDVYSIALDAFNFAVAIGGNTGGGFALLQQGTWGIIQQGQVAAYSSIVPALNTWTHLELQRRQFGAGIQTRLFVNGIDAGIFLTATPGNNIQPYFSIAGNVTGSGGIEGLFNGQIDNVRLFSYNPHPSTLSVQVQAGQVLVNSQGTPGAGYTLWRTPMLQPTSWTVVTNGIADGTGRVTLTDPAPPATGSFYRTSAP